VSQENVDFVKALTTRSEGFDRDELVAALPAFVEALCDPEVEWIEDPQRADGRVYRGHAGVLESWKLWLDQFDEWGWEAEQIVDCGDDVLVYAREHGRGASSGARVSARIFTVWTIREGKLLRYREFYDEQAALEAAGAA
jgi:ketosteroid isomerase-like protein